jgi:WW domain
MGGTLTLLLGIAAMISGEGEYDEYGFLHRFYTDTPEEDAHTNDRTEMTTLGKDHDSSDPVADLDDESTSSLPSGWQQFQDDAGIPYYYNIRTGQSQWTRPV